ncbi:MAG: DUF177 domain-containing protein [Caldicoprobacter oshimai]|uniref:DUF177 domain-containing protein n=1 Tax=Caldicoprobacter faecalis TaxID=937334 RepID=A0A1I5YTN7_9FIRM|nr:DUF177 domain-containing protein [Caldicoprobacter faecalis]SFQ47638.1 uncharacterized protein SAMN05444406_1653 [Caldicoprobacter faecalis]
MIKLVIDVSDILKEKGSSKEFSGSQPLEDIIYQGERIGLLGPVSVSGHITNTGKLLVLDADAVAKLSLQCARCTKRYDKELEFSFTARLSKVGDPEDPDIFLYEGEVVDLKDIILEFLLLELPMRRQCSEECKGLCPYCGRDLNIEQCQCEENVEHQEERVVDPRLLALKKALFANGEEV